MELTEQEKKEIRERMIKTATYKLKQCYVDINYESWESIDNTINSFLSEHPELTKKDIELNIDGDYDGKLEVYLEYKGLQDIEPLIEQEEKKVLRNKQDEYETYLKLKNKFN